MAPFERASPKQGGFSASASPWLLRRLLCCTGTLVLLQNLMLFHWTAGMHLGSFRSAAPSTTPEMEITTSQVVMKEVVKPQDGGEEIRRIRTLEAKLRELQEHQARVAASASVTEATDEKKSLTSMDSGKLGPRQLARESSLFTVPRDELRLFGRSVPESVIMSVGFGSVKRQKDYVLDTVGIMMGLRSSVPVTVEERSKVVIVAHFADFNLSWVEHISHKLRETYGDLIEEGHFHGIHAKEEFYPPLDLCPPICNYNDDTKRVKWRSKQNVDYSFLMYYAAPLAPYYLQLEDDINFAPNWISHITGFLTSSYPPTYHSKENAPWRMIDFSQLGFIGKMFQSDQLTRLAQFLLLFYDQMPCDILLGQWVLAMTQGKKIEYWKSHSSLFQHVGIFRSLGGFQTLQEKKFGKGPIFDNPPANVTRNFTIVPTYDTHFVYFPGGDPVNRNDVCDFSASPQKQKIKRCWFWAKNVKAGQHLTLLFQHDISMKAVLVEFGHDKHPTDLLQNGVLQVASSSTTAAFCGPYHDLMALERVTTVYWEEGVSSPASLPVATVRCLRIMALAPQQEWATIMQIQIRTA